MPLVNMTIKQLADHHTKDEFAREHFVNYFSMLLKTRKLGAQWLAQHPEEITDFQGYENIYNEFRSNMATVSLIQFVQCLRIYFYQYYHVFRQRTVAERSLMRLLLKEKSGVKLLGLLFQKLLLDNTFKIRNQFDDLQIAKKMSSRYMSHEWFLVRHFFCSIVSF